MTRGKVIGYALNLGASLLLWTLLAWLDYGLGMKIRFGPFYALPVLLLTWNLGPRWGLLAALVSGSLWHVIQLLVIPGETSNYFRYVDLLLGWVAFGAIALGTAWAKRLMEREATANRAHQQALERVRVLEGMLPICAWCQKVRDEQGSWEPVETYVSKHTNTTWTHGICPECEKKFKARGLA